MYFYDLIDLNNKKTLVNPDTIIHKFSISGQSKILLTIRSTIVYKADVSGD